MGTTEPTDLLQTYRDFMARMDIASKPERTFERGFYVPRQNFRIKDTVTRLLLEPNSTHLLVGGIGSGKTTELLQGCALINQHKDTKAIYIDVSEKQQLDKLEPGVLLALVGLELVSLLGPFASHDGRERAHFIGDLARGYVEDYPDSGNPDDGDYVPGIVTPPGPKDDNVRALASSLMALKRAEQKPWPHVVVFLDSLDRIHDPAKLEEVIKEDVAALKRLEIGVLLVGPLQFQDSMGFKIADHFDTDTRLPDIDVERDQEGRDFLFKVLRTREAAQLLPDETCSALVQMSGGILRDLLKLAKQAGQRAFMADAPHITPAHVQAAAEQEGRKLLFGVTEVSLGKLKALAKGERFILATKEDQTLLESRRIIGYQSDDGQMRYVLHPVMQSLLGPKTTDQNAPGPARKVAI